jgi:hypothetical protein
MKTSPIFGWPYAELNDARRPFPVDVDGPRTLGIEDALANGHRTTTYRIVIQSIPAGSAWTTMASTGTATGPDADAWSGGQFTLPVAGQWEITMRVLQISAVAPAADVTCRIGAGNAQGSGRLVPGVTWGGILAIMKARMSAGGHISGFTVWHGAAAAVPLEIVVTTEFVGS